MVMLYRGDAMATAGKFGDEFLDQRRLADFFGADDQQDLWICLLLVESVAVGKERSPSARDTKGAASDSDFAVKIDSLPTLVAVNPCTAVTGHLLLRYLNRYVLNGKKSFLRHDMIGLFLRLPWICGIRRIELHQRSRIIFCQNSNRIPCFGVHESCSHLAMVEKFQRTLT